MNDLGPNQLRWLDQHVAGFRVMREQANRAREQREAFGRRAEKAAGEALGYELVE